MAFTIKDMPDLTRILIKHPEWLAEVRRLVLTDELLNLPSLVRELATIQQRGEQRIERLEASVSDLISAQRHTDQQVTVLTQGFDKLNTAVTSLTAAVTQLTTAQAAMEKEFSSIKGFALEQKYIQRAPAYFGRWLRRVRVVLPSGLVAIEDLLETHLTSEELAEVLRLDIIIQGRLHAAMEKSEIYLAMEVSGAIEPYDVERAERRTDLLRKAGLRAIPVVAGERLTPEADELLQDRPVLVFQNGRSWGWEQALAALEK